MTKNKESQKLREILGNNEPPDIREDKIPYHQKYSTGYEQGLWESEEMHKEVIYKMVMDFYRKTKD